MYLKINEIIESKSNVTTFLCKLSYKIINKLFNVLISNKKIKRYYFYIFIDTKIYVDADDNI